MSSILVVSAVTFAAFYVWLAVRIVNRRERWAKWTAAVLAVPTIYLLSMGPVLWMNLHGLTPAWASDVPLYWPVQWIRENGPGCSESAFNNPLTLPFSRRSTTIMQNWTAASAVFAQAIPPGTSFGAWVVGVLGTLSSVIVLVSGLLIFGGACYLVATKRRPAVLAACLVLLPLPVLIAIFGEMRGMVSALTAIASSPGMTVPTEHVAADTAASLVAVLFAMLVSAPTYFLLAFGLLSRTLRSPPDDIPPTAIRSKLREPLPSSGGSVPVATQA